MTQPSATAPHDTYGALDIERMRRYRLARLQEQMRAREIEAMALFDPANIRYAVGLASYGIYSLHTPVRCLIVPAEGLCTVLDYDSLEFFSDAIETIGTVRSMPSYHYALCGERAGEGAARLVQAIGEALKPHTTVKRVAVDRFEPSLAQAFQEANYRIEDAQVALEHARAIKSPEEVACMRTSISIAETALHRIRDAVRPGARETELCAILHEENIANGGEWFEYKLVCSGERTNPWGQEASGRAVRAGDLVIVDTGMIGPLGYFADVSRTFHCGPGAPTPEQKRLYGLARACLDHNVALLKPGLSFADFVAQAWEPPEDCRTDNYPHPLHGVGMRGEWPMLWHHEESDRKAYDGAFEVGMTLAVEAYIGPSGGKHGVKLEDTVLVTKTGVERLSTFPMEDRLL
ncbi:MAG: Xaa-Pro peptidase family protein [Alphaproteobacteria bacterium]|nr:Xaa-Pro peptidase family protein [Alphaproteobacteria bacterium]